MKQKPEFELITHNEWDEHFWQYFRVLRRQNPTRPLEYCRKDAYSHTEALHGPRPPSWKWLLVKLGWGLVKSGGNVDFSWTKNAWKAVRAALGVALAAGLYAVFDVLSPSFDTPAELEGMGAPQFLIPLILAVLVSLRNWLKHSKGARVP
jgi:hypothetical protein